VPEDRRGSMPGLPFDKFTRYGHMPIPARAPDVTRTDHASG
jgi:hypothetical protein